MRSPGDLSHAYRRFLDGVEEPLHRDDLTMLAVYKEGEIGNRKSRPSETTCSPE